VSIENKRRDDSAKKNVEGEKVSKVCWWRENYDFGKNIF
jgi:hypothetical protein